MGLDVYLKKCPDRALADQIEQEYEEKTDAIWKEIEGGQGYDSLTDADKDAAHKRCEAVRQEMGLEQYGVHPTRETIEINSALYPEHYFKIGYFRSSYNDSGINSYFRRLDLPDLYWIMGQSGEDDIVPDWDACLVRVNTVIEQYKAIKAGPMGKYDVFDIDPVNLFGGRSEVSDDKSALALFAEILVKSEGRPDDFRAWSSQQGTFYLDGLKVVALINGTKTFIRNKQPAIYVVYEREESADWYLQSLEIVRETIQYVLAQPDKEHYYMVWSG